MALLRLGKNGTLMLNGREVKPMGQGTNVAVLIDTSDSMADDKLEQVKDGTLDFAAAVIEKGYNVCAVVFGDRAAVACNPLHDSAELARKIRGLRVGMVGGTTHIGAGLAVCAKVPNLSHILVVTDGAASDGDYALSLADNLKAEGVEILTLGTHDADRLFLQRLASRLGLSIQTHDSELRTQLAKAGQLLLGGGQ